jgi:hypothetical protein
MHLTVYTDSKGIWTIESTVEDLYKVLQDVKTSLKVLPSVVPEEFFFKYPAFSAPQVIPQYGNLYKYTTKSTASVSHDVNNDDKSYVVPPRNVWNRGPPKTIRKSNQPQNTNVSSVTLNPKKQSQTLLEQFTEIKQNLEQYQRANQEILNNINNKLETKMNDNRTMIKEIVKDILQAELKEILPEMMTTILQQIKESTDQLLRIVKDVPGQRKPTNTDKMSVLTQTTQGSSKESLLDSDGITPSQSDDEVILLTQEDAEKQKIKT